MSLLKLTLLGYPKLEVDSHAIQPSRRKALALLAYLAVTGKSHSREALASLLWPDYPSATALAHLRRTLHTIRTDLGAHCLVVDRARVALNLSPGVWCDVNHIRHLLATYNADCQHELHGSCATCLMHLSTIIELYTDDFLAGFLLHDCPEFELWQSLESEILRQEVVMVLEKLALAAEKAGQLHRVLGYWERLLQLMPLHDFARQSLMRLYTNNGQRDTALRLYHTYCRQLAHELNAQPALPLVQLYERIRAGQEIGQQDKQPQVMSAAQRTNGARATPPAPPLPPIPVEIQSGVGPHAALGVLQRQKQRHFFRLIDRDGDGLIGWPDFECYVIQAATLLALPIVDAACQRALSDLRNWWGGLAVASTLLNQQTQPPAASEQRGVTLEAWLLYWSMVQLTVAEEATLGGRETLARMEESVHVHFRLFDQDRDGALAVAEYRHWVLAWGLTTDAAHNFQRLDRDGDGYLRPAELAEYLRQFHFSNDPDAPGNAFYGEFQG